jgi:hypothetical protein
MNTNKMVQIQKNFIKNDNIMLKCMKALFFITTHRRITKNLLQQNKKRFVRVKSNLKTSYKVQKQRSAGNEIIYSFACVKADDI